jgi:DNA-binding NtrC family response regulator
VKLKATLPTLDPRRDQSPNEQDMVWAKNYAWPGNIRQLEAALRIWLMNIAWMPTFTLVDANKPIEHVFIDRDAKQPRSLDFTLVKAHFRERLSQARAGTKIKSFEEELTIFLGPIRDLATKALVESIEEQALTRNRDELARILDPNGGITAKTAGEWVSEKRKLFR